MTEDIDKYVLKKYDILNRIGRGAYGIVWKSVQKNSKKVVALKKIFDAFHNATDAQRTFREIMFLQELNHDNIIKLLDVHRAENDRDIYLVFEHMETDLHSVIRANILQNIHKKYIVYQTLKCIKYMHSGGLIHRDLKPSNLLLNSECLVKVCDFGLARSIIMNKKQMKKDLNKLNNINNGKHVNIHRKNVPNEPILTDYIATRWYRAPEILLGSKGYTYSIDMWSIGCILAELLGNKPLFPGKSTMNQLDKIIDIIGYPNKNDIKSINSPFADTMLQNIIQTNKINNNNNNNNSKQSKHKKLFELYPNAQPDSLNLLYKLLQFNPKKRINSYDSLNHPYLSEFHNTEDEPELSNPIKISIDDNVKFNVKDYREKLYSKILDRKKQIKLNKRNHIKKSSTHSNLSTNNNNHKSSSNINSNKYKKYSVHHNNPYNSSNKNKNNYKHNKKRRRKYNRKLSSSHSNNFINKQTFNYH